MEKMDRLTIQTHSKEERMTILRGLLGLGYKWHGSSFYDPERIDKEFSFQDYPG